MTGLASFAVRLAVTIVVVAVAAVVGWQLWIYYMEAPWTRDGALRADVVKVAPDVSGLVAQVLVHNDEAVHQGQVLFRIDPIRFQLALQQANATVTGKEAAAQEAVREMNRYRQLTTVEVSIQEQQQYTSKAAEAGADYQLAVANRDVAQLNLDRSVVRASVNGIVSNFDMRPGDYVTQGTPIFALIDTDSLYVDGYFEETKLPLIHVGDQARVKLMGQRGIIRGHVISISAGVADRERSSSSSLLADITPTFAWVRLPQRIPIRIHLDHVPPEIKLVVGRTASVQIMEKTPGLKFAGIMP
ncbi:MAG TPA: HlyD family secretion protein [Acetobacteraceae bacterium]|nr:HlyD family secretion protein [Acetobacteraceae bacterium]